MLLLAPTPDGIDHAGNKYLLDGVAHKMDLADKWRWIRDLREKWLAETGVHRGQRDR